MLEKIDWEKIAWDCGEGESRSKRFCNLSSVQINGDVNASDNLQQSAV